MEAVIYFLIWGALIFLMMRFGCGAHVMGRGHGQHGSYGTSSGRDELRWVLPETDVDLVCGLKYGYPRETFERVRKVSEINETFYRAFVSPWVQMVATPWTAEVGKWLHPMRTSCYLLSEAFNPWMCSIRLAAGAVAKNRRPLASDHPLIAQERRMDDEMRKFWNACA